MYRRLAHTVSYQLHRLESGPPESVEVAKEVLLKMYRSMTVMRRMESTADQLYKQKLIRGFCHLNTGQEAISVGIENAITSEDAIITAYRCHGFVYMRGASVSGILSELMGRKDGITLGKGGSMHMFAKNFYGGNGIVGAQVPVGAGISLALKYKRQPNICITLYGDGAANQGQVFEAYNMAKLWGLPCLFACENNGYAMGTSCSRGAASTKYYTRGDYIPGLLVDGMDTLAVFNAMQWAKQYILQNGPLVVEFATYRYGGHSMSDPGTTYRTRDEIGQVRSTRDCLQGLRQIMLNEGINEKDIQNLELEAKEEVDQAAAKAASSPEPDVGELHSQIYVNCIGKDRSVFSELF